MATPSRPVTQTETADLPHLAGTKQSRVFFSVFALGFSASSYKQTNKQTNKQTTDPSIADAHIEVKAANEAPPEIVAAQSAYSKLRKDIKRRSKRAKANLEALANARTTRQRQQRNSSALAKRLSGVKADLAAAAEERQRVSRELEAARSRHASLLDTYQQLERKRERLVTNERHRQAAKELETNMANLRRIFDLQVKADEAMSQCTRCKHSARRVAFDCSHLLLCCTCWEAVSTESWELARRHWEQGGHVPLLQPLPAPSARCHHPQGRLTDAAPNNYADNKLLVLFCFSSKSKLHR